MSEPTTVREVLEEYIDGFLEGEPRERWIADVIAHLRTVLSTGEHYRARRVPARDLLVGDAMVAKDSRLWSVSSFPPPTDSEGDGSRDVVIHRHVVIVRGEDVRTMTFASDREVPILLTATDARALAILERELGAVEVKREAA